MHLALALAVAAPLAALPQDPSEWELDVFEPEDVFELEYASDPQVSPDGKHVVYVRNSMDVMTDRQTSNLWIVDVKTGEETERHRPLTSGTHANHSPRWSRDGEHIAWISNATGSPQIHVRWMDTGESAVVTNLTEPPGGLSWAGKHEQYLLFAMFVPDSPEPMAEMPAKPEGAEWAPPPRVIRTLRYRDDGSGYRREGNHHLFLQSLEGGTPRQLTHGPFDHRGTPSASDKGRIYFSANRRADGEHRPLDTEIYSTSLYEPGPVRELTERFGPDHTPVASPDGERVAYLGFDDRRQGYQLTRLYVMNEDGSDVRCLTESLDRSVANPIWAPWSDEHLYFQFDDHGVGRIGVVSLDGDLVELQGPVIGGTSLGRPYTGGSYSVGPHERVVIAFTQPGRSPDDGPALPSNVCIRTYFTKSVGITESERVRAPLNEDLFAHKELGRVEELWAESSHDSRPIQAWVVTPPGFDPNRRYPLILEIHGGPFASYGPLFSAEIQLYAAAGYVVVYANPRGSTSYGEEFGNLIHHAYPGHDYDDLMSVVDAVLAKGYVDPERLFVTGGSGGGVLTAWIVGKTDRFRAAVVAKPVVNWTSFALTADAYTFFWQYWFPGFPWNHPEEYFARSPLSLVGNVTTPTMLLTGEEDYRTPISESEQLYQALQLRRVPSALVRIPGASHGIAARPSHLIAKVAHILAWFAEHDVEQADEDE